MKRVSDILEEKGSEVWCIGPEDAVYEALRIMAEKEVGALVVCRARDVVGIISERDYARKVALRNTTEKETPVREIMTRDVYFVRPTHKAHECLALMTGKRCRHLPVLDDAGLVGIISIGDAVKAVIEEQELLIAQLERYIIRGG